MLIENNLEMFPMKEEDLFFVNTTRNIPSTRQRLENDKIISIENTKKWFLEKSPKWFIISLDSKKVGYFRTSDDTGKSICIGCDIHPENRRMGIAKRAYILFLDYLASVGYTNIWLEVFRENIPAMNLYLKLGFLEIGERTAREEKYVTMVYNRCAK